LARADEIKRKEPHMSLAIAATVRTKIGAMREHLLALLAEHEGDGALPTNARFLFYELVQRGVVSKERPARTDGKIGRRPDQDVHDALTDIREDGQVPWDWITDETRSLEDYTGYASVKAGVLSKLPHINLDPWRGRAPMIITESRSLAGTLRNVVGEYRARIASTNGQCGGFLHTDIVPAMQPGDRVLYLGDWDWAGTQIEANTRRVLGRELGPLPKWERVALTKEQVEEHDLPRIIKRDKRYLDGRPHEAVETEALSQVVLMDILRGRLAALLPEPLDRVLERERRQRRSLPKLLGGAA
jgi:hypothetical protein